MPPDLEALQRHAEQIRGALERYRRKAKDHRDQAAQDERLACDLASHLVEIEQQIARAAGTSAPFP